MAWSLWQEPAEPERPRLQGARRVHRQIYGPSRPGEPPPPAPFSRSSPVCDPAPVPRIDLCGPRPYSLRCRPRPAPRGPAGGGHAHCSLDLLAERPGATRLPSGEGLCLRPLAPLGWRRLAPGAAPCSPGVYPYCRSYFFSFFTCVVIFVWVLDIKSVIFLISLFFYSYSVLVVFFFFLACKCVTWKQFSLALELFWMGVKLHLI